jgi:hypothetical protein
MPPLAGLLNQMYNAENNIRFFKTNRRNRGKQAANTRKANAALREIINYTNEALLREKNRRLENSRTNATLLRKKTRPSTAARPARLNSTYKHPHDIEMEKLMKVILGKPKRR